MTATQLARCGRSRRPRWRGKRYQMRLVTSVTRRPGSRVEVDVDPSVSAIANGDVIVVSTVDVARGRQIAAPRSTTRGSASNLARAATTVAASRVASRSPTTVGAASNVEALRRRQRVRGVEGDDLVGSNIDVDAGRIPVADSVVADTDQPACDRRAELEQRWWRQSGRRFVPTRPGHCVSRPPQTKPADRGGPRDDRRATLSS